MIYADREADRTVVHHINLHPVLVEEVEDMAQVIFHNKGKIVGKDGNQYLVYLEDKGGHRKRIGCLIDGSTFLLNVDKGTYLKRDALVFERLDGLRMNDIGSVITQLNGIEVGKLRNELRVGEPFRIGIQYAGYIFPDGNRFRIQAGSENCRRIVGSVTSERRGKVFGGPSDKSLGNANMLLH